MKDNKDGKHLSREELITELQNALSDRKSVV